jgi:hypothetical protein
MVFFSQLYIEESLEENFDNYIENNIYYVHASKNP